MSTFTQRPDVQMLAPPYQIDHARTAAFIVPAAEGSIQRLLDSTLNAAPGRRTSSGCCSWLKNLFPSTPQRGSAPEQRFKPLLDVMALTFIHYPRMSAPETPWGYFSYQECAVFLPLWDTEGVLPSMCWHVPFILLNQFLPTVVGREIYGFPKVMAQLDCTPLLADDWLENPRGKLTVAAEGFGQTGANVAAQSVPVAEVTMSSFPDGSLVKTIDHAGDILLALTQDLAGGDHLQPALIPVLKELLQIGLPGIFLKELVGSRPDEPAAYRKLVKAAFTPTGIGGASFVRGEVKLSNPASYPLASTFGIPAGQALDVSGLLIDLSWNLPPPTDA